MKDLILPICLMFALAFDEASGENSTGAVNQTLIWPDGTRYVGGVLNGKRSGKGTIFWQDGTRFVGQFENDLRIGPGTMILPDGTVYTGVFKNDELLDTETKLPPKESNQGFDEAKTIAALEDTELPMEADSLSELPSSKTTEYDKDNHATNEFRADSSSGFSEPLDENDSYLSSSPNPSDKKQLQNKIKSVTDGVKEQLVNTVDLWAAAWADQDLPQYLSYYSKGFKVPNKKSRKVWESVRRIRLTKPSYINLNIEYQKFELVDYNLVEVFFQQTYRSNTYSDSTDKVLRMRKEGTEWKILHESNR